MLVTELRTKSGLSYSARSSLARHSQPGSVFITSFTETGTTVEAINVALSTLGQFQDAGLNDEMLLSARNYVMGQYPPRFETAAQIDFLRGQGVRLVQGWYFSQPLPAGEFAKYLAALNAGEGEDAEPAPPGLERPAPA